MASLLSRLGRFSFRRRWWVLSFWIAAVLGTVGAAAAFHGEMTTNFSIPGTESQRVLDELEEALPDAAGGSAAVVFHTPDGTFSAAQEAAVPDSLLEAARLDGAGELRIFATIVLRLMSPAVVTVFLFQFVGIWNNFFLPLVMLSEQSLYPVTLGLVSWQSVADRNPEFYQLTVGGALLSVIPIMIAIASLQRYWRAGLTEGSVKG